jgi:hypothetical protein
MQARVGLVVTNPLRIFLAPVKPWTARTGSLASRSRPIALYFSPTALAIKKRIALEMKSVVAA